MTRNTEFTGKVDQFLLFFTLVLYICYVINLKNLPIP